MTTWGVIPAECVFLIHTTSQWLTTTNSINSTAMFFTSSNHYMNNNNIYIYLIYGLFVYYKL